MGFFKFAPETIDFVYKKCLGEDGLPIPGSFLFIRSRMNSRWEDNNLAIYQMLLITADPKSSERDCIIKYPNLSLVEV